MWRVALLPLSAAFILLVLGVILEEKNWSALGRWSKELWQDIINPNPLFPGPYTRFLGRFLGVRVRSDKL